MYEMSELQLLPTSIQTASLRPYTTEHLIATASRVPDGLELYAAGNPMPPGGTAPSHESDLLGETNKLGKLRLDAQNGLSLFDDSSKSEILKAIYAANPKSFESVIGEDNRILVPKAAAWPYSCQGRLLAQFRAGLANSSGTLISHNHVLTAAHCVFNNQWGGWTSDISFSAGYSDGVAPFENAKGARVYVPKGWITDQTRSEYDFAIIVLDKESGRKSGFMGIAQFLTSEALLQLRVAVGGYPGDKGGEKQFTQTEILTSVSDERMAYLIDTAKGQSGSSIYTSTVPGAALSEAVVGVHSDGYGTSNGGTRINKDVFESILSVVNAV